MIKNIFFDLDDTILDFRRAELQAITKTLSNFGIDPTDGVISLYREINRTCWEALERREMTRETVLTKRFELVFARLGASADPHEVQHFYERRLSEGYYFVDGAESLLDRLAGKYDLYITSNGISFVQDRRILGSGIRKYFKDVFISERLGANKPSQMFFNMCFMKMANKNRKETIIVGDSLTSDILGGLDAGIHTCHFTGGEEVKYKDIRPEFSIKKLGELEKVLEKL